MKIFVLAFSILCLGCSAIESVNLNCEIKTEDWEILGVVYTCNAESQGDIITDISNRDVTTINGSTSTNPSVKVVDIYKSNCFYFPHNLEKFFINLEGIQIIYSKLREVRREDLKEYTNLRELSLYNNEIQFLEENLFEFNPKLERILLESNKIAHIDVNIFNNFVDKLYILWLSDNICQFENAWGDKSKANQIIEEVQSGSCQDISKLPTTTTTTTTTPAPTTTTPAPTTTTPAPPPPVTSAQLDTLTKLIGNLQVSLMQEIKALNNKLEATKAEIKKDIKEVKDQNLDIKAGLGNITTQFEKRVMLIENIVGVDPEHYNQP